jgi:hypothetical protein
MRQSQSPFVSCKWLLGLVRAGLAAQSTCLVSGQLGVGGSLLRPKLPQPGRMLPMCCTNAKITEICPQLTLSQAFCDAVLSVRD